jgi:hypothetical protein
MSYQEKLDAALALIREHNDAVGEGNPGYVDEEKFIQSLKAFGSTAEDDLKGLSWAQILKVIAPALTKDPDMPEPEGLAKKIATSWRPPKDGQAPSEGDAPAPAYVSAKKARRMSPRELIEAFDPEEPDSDVGKRLRSLSKGQPFLVYSQGRVVDVEASLTLLLEVKQNFPPRKTYEGKRVYNIGDLPDAYAEENPLYPGRPLRPDGSCDQLNRSWAGISTEIRQFVRVMLECRVYTVSCLEDGHYILDLIVNNDDPLKTLRERYQDATVEFDDRQKRNDLPNLLVTLTPSAPDPVDYSDGVKGTPGPFEDGKRVAWFAAPDPASNYYSNTADRSTANREWQHKLAEAESRARQYKDQGGTISPLGEHMARKGKRRK